MCSENILFYYPKAVKLVLLSDRAGPGSGRVRCLGPRPYEGRAKASTSGLDPGPSRANRANRARPCPWTVYAQPFAAQGRHFWPLSSLISWIVRPRAFSSRSSSPKWERSCSCWREGGEWHWTEGGLEGKDVQLNLGVLRGLVRPKPEWCLARLAAALATSISKCFSVSKDNARAIKLSAQLFLRGEAKNLYHNSYSKLSWISLPSWIHQI